MKKEKYLNYLQSKVNEFQSSLEVLQDDAERGDSDNAEDYQVMVADLFRKFEEIRSKLDEVESMSDEEYSDERKVLDGQIESLEQDIDEARGKIKDV